MRDYVQNKQLLKDIDGERLRDTLEKYVFKEIASCCYCFLGEPPKQFLWERCQKKDTSKRNSKKWLLRKIPSDKRHKVLKEGGETVSETVTDNKIKE